MNKLRWIRNSPPGQGEYPKGERVDNREIYASICLTTSWLATVLFLLLLCAARPAQAQEHVLHAAVFGAGGGRLTGGDQVLQGTLGQPFTGTVAGAERIVQAGFWHRLSPFLLAAPALSSPADGASDVPRSTTLSWGAIQGATSYHLQLSETDDFLSPLVDSTGIEGTSFDVTGLEGTTEYFWRVRATGIGIFSSTFTFTTVTGVGIDDGSIPERMDLKQNYPNPFNPRTTIAFDVSEPAHVRVVVYDMLGREVRIAVDAPYRPGRHQVVFESAGLPSGVYVYRFIAGDHVITRRMVLLK